MTSVSTLFGVDPTPQHFTTPFNFNGLISCHIAEERCPWNTPYMIIHTCGAWWSSQMEATWETVRDHEQRICARAREREPSETTAGEVRMRASHRPPKGQPLSSSNRPSHQERGTEQIAAGEGLRQSE